MSTHLHKYLVRALAAVLCTVAGVAGAAVIYTETFGSAAGWTDRDLGVDMDVSYAGGVGHPPGSLEGVFYEQTGTPSPETDAWRAGPGASLGKFTGDYWGISGGFTAWRFSFYAANVLPSDLTIRFGDNINTFSMALGSQVTSAGSWFTIDVPLTYGGWFGGSAADFSNALGAVSFIDVQITRNGTNEQFYNLDNFQLHNETSVSVPEPATGLFWFGAVVLYGLRRRMNRDPSEG